MALQDSRIASASLFNEGDSGQHADVRPAIFVLDPNYSDAISTLSAANDIDFVLPGDSRRHIDYEQATVLLLRSKTQITAEDIKSYKKLEAIVKQGVSTDNIDLRAAADASVKVFNTPGLNSETVAELSISMALALARRIPKIDRRIRSGEPIIPSQALGVSLYGKTLGLVGMGAIASSLAKKWIGGMDGRTAGYDPYYNEKMWSSFPADKVRRVSFLDEMPKVADVVSIHVPLTDTTRDMISTPQLNLMKPNVILINAARGGIANEKALVETLKGRKLFGVGLDTLEVEPPTLQTCKDLLSFPNVLVTPHIGASIIENQSQSGLATVEMALSLARGQESGSRVV
ncbi:D-isomer specific 2-hydroxyacid dehydrogenase [Microdochium trichocladiopsis]|uniref:D-isomer specific 2-hydroxyacid dehydrogenase n=1 Tax=Microdochium trichocladiopsis TaxID=1682393 RepID=A0A9P8Y3A1_9PEZI|nr:D-isomer specific 2-hydroxyacid dehydrogenase [Microdochium trichocladiopsis]KAH7028938.1 D-isomer specific 2-hydroxyacid dehydrogenase [Microdochium trichocladiopsis]